MAILSVCYDGVGGITGVMVGGWLYQVYGPRAMYRIKGAAVAVVLLIYTGVYAVPAIRKKWAPSSEARKPGKKGGTEREPLLASKAGKYGGTRTREPQQR
jgi:uncharacterized membrane protein YfcA